MSDAFSDLLRRLRREAGLSQEALAERAALSKDAVSSLERGTRRAPYRETLLKLASALGLDARRQAEFESAAALGRARKDTGGDRDASALPLAGSPLVGRTKAIARIVELLDQRPLVTVTGSGGIGKTRVAVAVAERFLRERATPVWFVDLAAVRFGTGVAGKIAASMHARIAGSGDSVEELVASLEGRSGLILIDNCEHVIDEAARAAAAILSSRPRLAILATSRERLAIESESVYLLEALDPASALALFEQRAASVASSFALTTDSTVIAGDICRQLDGVPLAIELAAARVPFLGLGELRARLRGQLTVLAGGRRDAPERQQTMYDTVAWSYALLDAGERALFRRLAVFAGGWCFDAVDEVVQGAPLDPASLLRTFASLVEKSLVSVDLAADPVRYRLLDPVRAFAQLQLESAGESAEHRRRHAQWIAQRAELAEMHSSDSPSRDHAAFVATEIDNARSALEWALHTAGDACLAARIIGGLGGALARIGLLAECRRWCEAILAQLDGDAHPHLAARVYRALIVSMGGKDEIAAILGAIPFVERAGDWNGVAVLTSRLALRYGERGRFDDAERAFSRVWQIREEFELGTSPEWATIWMHRGSVFRRQGRLEDAEAAVAQSLEMARALNKPLHEMWSLVLAAEVAFARAEPQRAITIASEALELCARYRHAVVEILTRANLGGYYLALADYDRARVYSIAAIARGREAEPGVVLAAIVHLAAAEASTGQLSRAAVLKGFFDRSRRQEALDFDPTQASSYASLTSTLERELDPHALADLVREGAAMHYTEVADLATAGGEIAPFTGS